MKKYKNTIIIFSVIFCLFSIYFYKNNNDKKINENSLEGFEYYTNKNYDIEEDLDGKYPIVMILGSQMCQPCNDMQPMLKKLNKEYQGTVKIKYVDILKNPKMKEKYSPRVTPTTFFFDESGEFRYFIEGTTTESNIIEGIEKLGEE